MSEEVRLSEQFAFDLRETSRVTGISYAKIHEAYRRKLLPHFRLGKRVVIPRNALLKWLDEQAEHFAELDV